MNNVVLVNDPAVLATGDGITLRARRAARRRQIARANRINGADDRNDARGRAEIEHQLIDAHARLYLRAAPLWAGAVIAIAFAAAHWLDPLTAGAWAALMLAGMAVKAALCTRYIKAAPSGDIIARWRRHFVVLAALLGVQTGVLILMLPTDAQTTAPFTLAVTLIGVCGHVALSSNLASAMVVGIVPITFSAVISLSAAANAVSLLLAGSAIAVTALLVTLGLRLHRCLRDQMSFRAEKARLINDLEDANASSQEARRQAVEARLANSRLLATMNHELRTPLTAILGFSEVIQKEVLGPVHNTTYREYVRDIHGSGKQVLRLIDDMLDTTPIEDDTYTLVEEPVSLASLTRACSRLVKLRHGQASATLDEQLPDHLPLLLADERAVRQVIITLLTAALTRSVDGANGQVVVGWTRGGGQYVSVSPCGPDQHGFENVRRLMDAHGGDLDVTTDADGVATAVAAFPRARVIASRPAQLRQVG